jgi:hypothetical protein
MIDDGESTASDLPAPTRSRCHRVNTHGVWQPRQFPCSEGPIGRSYFAG